MKIFRLLFAVILFTSGLYIDSSGQEEKTSPPEEDIAFDKAPEVIKQVQPKYPASMLENGMEATVFVKAFITTDGIVKEARCEKIQIKAIRSDKDGSSPDEKKIDGKTFEEAALAAVRQWKFSPAQMQGKPVAVWVTIPFRFKLNDKEKKNPEISDAEKEKETEAIRENIENILKGADLEKAKQFTDKNALLVYNTETAKLYSVLSGEQKNITLKEEKEAGKANVKFRLTCPSENSAIVVYESEHPKSKKSRVHTIVLTRTQAKEWKITHWHVSF